MAQSALLPSDATVTAVLGPTNTGKTRYAIERMLARADGIIGLPLRLLAREVYDKIVELRGPGCVALITGEERIQPRNARYFVCTVEAMPLDRLVDFVAIDEVQMCADPERGHVFTDRVLRARGRYETLFLGSDAARARISALVPEARYLGRERFSTLSYAGSKKISRLKPRSAVVAFSIDQVYAIAELIRRQRGGAAVVMGALSPRTRNAQVALYQQGDVDYLVATDAIGMGLNLDVDHVAFAGLSKFDGRHHRRLQANELAQIAGRAGRYTKDGTFGTTGEALPIEPEVVEAIEGHRFKPIARFLWRNHRLSFANVPALIASLEESPQVNDLARGREADDLAALKLAWQDSDLNRLADRPERVRLLWDVCQIPDFRKVTDTDHLALISHIYRFLLGAGGVIPSDWIAGQVRRIDRTEGDIDTLSKRLAYIRTWTYVTNRAAWVEGAAEWQAETRAVEDRLSDALHAKLTQRFVDRRTSVLMRRLKQKERLVAEVNDKGEVVVEGEFLGRLDGFRFHLDETASAEEIKTLRSASLGAVQAELARRADKLYNSPDTEIDVTEQGGLMWGTDAVGALVKGDECLAPKVRAFVEDTADPSVVEKVERRLSHWVRRRIDAQFEPLLKMQADEAVTGLARGLAFQLSEEMGVIPRRRIAEDVKALGQEERALLRKHGVRFGQHTIFLPLLLKPAPTRLRLLLWSLWQGFQEFPAAPPPGQVTIPALSEAPEGFYDKAGYRLAGTRALRIDMLERLADMLRPMDARAGFEATPDMLSITGCTLEQFADLMNGLGFQGERGERVKPVRGPAGKATTEAAPVQAEAPEAEAPKPEAAMPETVEGLAEADAAPAMAPQAQPTTDAPAAPESPPAAPVEPPAVETETASEQPTLEPATAEATEAPAENAEAPTEAAPAEMEVFFTFTLRPRRPAGQPRRNRQGEDQQDGQKRRRRPQREGAAPANAPAANADAAPEAATAAPAHAKPGRHAKADGPRKPRNETNSRPPKKNKPGDKPRVHAAAPKREQKPVDPDSPFAILQQLKNK